MAPGLMVAFAGGGVGDAGVDYRSSESTFCCDWLAWASIAVEA